MSLSNRERQVVLASADPLVRERLRVALTGMRWNVREANGGAEALAHLEQSAPNALLVDGWLPDLEVHAFSDEVRHLYPTTELLSLDGTVEAGGGRSAHRHELLQALRELTRTSGTDSKPSSTSAEFTQSHRFEPAQNRNDLDTKIETSVRTAKGLGSDKAPVTTTPSLEPVEIPGLLGRSVPMLELARLIRLVAPHTARVLIEGQTGTGKELVAKALHALSNRSKKPFIVLNCAAIPEALLEAELFGHTRGAFTGAVQSRTGRIEAAHGGTLFLDEIGEMPLSLQAKLLRFLENGELQRVGDNEPVRVDVRVISATHQKLGNRVMDGSFRLDLFHRLAVFPLSVPSLQQRIGDLPALAEHFLVQFASENPRKYLSPAAVEKLGTHNWPGNVRELGNVVQRAVILAGPRSEISTAEIVLHHSLLH